MIESQSFLKKTIRVVPRDSGIPGIRVHRDCLLMFAMLPMPSRVQRYEFPSAMRLCTQKRCPAAGTGRDIQMCPGIAVFPIYRETELLCGTVYEGFLVVPDELFTVGILQFFECDVCHLMMIKIQGY